MNSPKVLRNNTYHTTELISFWGLDSPELLEKIRRLRTSVWKQQKTRLAFDPATNEWMNEGDDIGYHIAVTCNQHPIAASRLNLHSSLASLSDVRFYGSFSKHLKEPIAEICRLVVLQNYARQGLSKFLDAKLIALAASLHAGCVYCEVPEYRLQTLETRGFERLHSPKRGVMFPDIQWTPLYLKFPPSNN